MHDDEELELLQMISKTPKPLFARTFPIIFFWSPKGGCTTLIKWYFYQIGILERALGYNPWVHYFRMNVYQKQHNYEVNIKEHLVRGDKATYKLVRNPYTRAVSSFLHTASNPKIMNAVFPDVTDGITFKQFLYKARSIGVKRGMINYHIAQQYYQNEELFIHNHVKLEQFNKDIRAVERKYSLKESPLDQISQSHHHKSQHVQQMEKLPYAGIKFTRASIKDKPLPPYDYFYSDDETREIVRELFKDDFMNYGYDPNDY